MSCSLRLTLAPHPLCLLQVARRGVSLWRQVHVSTPPVLGWLCGARAGCQCPGTWRGSRRVVLAGLPTGPSPPMPNATPPPPPQPHPHPLNPHPQTHLCFRYAHGEHELRYVPPEIVAQLEAQQKMQDAGGQRIGSGEGGDRGRGDDSSAAGPGGGHQSFYKTRLCIKYMQTGYCHKGASCTFAHGYEDLRQPGTPISPGRMQQVRITACPVPPGKQVPADSRRAELGFREVQAELPAGQKDIAHLVGSNRHAAPPPVQQCLPLACCINLTAPALAHPPAPAHQQDTMSPGRIGMAPAPGMPMMAPAGEPALMMAPVSTACFCWMQPP